MIDFELQMRFWRNFTDAVLHSTDASFAAASIWQDQNLASGKSPGVAAPVPAPSMTGWPWIAAFAPAPKESALAWPQMWWLDTPAPAAASNPFAAMMPTQMLSMMTAFMPWADTMWQAASAFGPQSPMAQMAKTMAPFWPWPDLTWTYMQTPLTAMLMSTGMPYAVASPSAKASTAAMDAADAARQQLDHVYAACNSDSGKAAMQLAILPWTLAVTFMDHAAKPAD